MRSLILLLAFAVLFVKCQNDLAVLNYALTLEHLESAFYIQGIAMFTETDFVNAGYPSYAYSEFKKISANEITHVETLTSVIEASYPNMSVPPCQYRFPINNVTTFVEISRSLERTGVSAYLGRVQDIVSKDILTAAGTIVTVEARHASFLNIISKFSGTPQPFDTPLNVRAVVSIASELIVSCPYDLGVAPYPTLTLSAVTDTQITLLMDGMTPTGAFNCYFFSATQAFTTLSSGSCPVPAGMSGDIYVFLTNSTTALTLAPGGDSSIVAGPAILTVRAGFALDETSSSQPSCSMSTGYSVRASATSATIQGIFISTPDVTNNRYGSMMTSDGGVMSYYSTSAANVTSTVVFVSGGATIICSMSVDSQSLTLVNNGCVFTQGDASCTPTVSVTKTNANTLDFSSTCGTSTGSVSLDVFALSVLG